MDKNPIMSRMKNNYELRCQTFLTRRSVTICRIDGRAFHSLTRGMDRPFDDRFISCMQYTAKVLCEEIQGCKIAMQQSDEISLLLTDYDNLDTDAWFNYNVQKMTSISASIATYAFNAKFKIEFPELDKMALFDSRVFTVPKEEACNYFIARQQDMSRNSVSMIAQYKFSHKELQGRSTSEMQEMLFKSFGENWNDLPTHKKRGTCIVKTENGWEADLIIPIFSQNRNYIERFVFLDKEVAHV